VQIHRNTQLSFVFILSLLASACAQPSAAKPSFARQRVAQSEQMAKLAAASQGRIKQSLDELPLNFVENQGQADARVAYYVPGKDNTIYFTARGLTFALTAPLTPTSALDAASQAGTKAPLGYHALSSPPPEVQRWAVKLDFMGANPNARPVGQARTDAVFSYFKGQPNQWQAGVPSYARLRYADLWPGIDLVYSGQGNQLKYEFVVQPASDPAQIQLAYRGANAVNLTSEGQLEVMTPLGGFRDATPVAYQEKDGQRVPVEMSYALSLPTGSGYAGYGFHLGPYDASLPLVLDPAVLIYAGYIGGAGDDSGSSIAVDGAGNAYVTGSTASNETTFPMAVGPDFDYNGGYDAFVAKVNATGTALVYAGYIGGAANDYAIGIAVDRAGSAYITGITNSNQSTFPVTVGPDLTFNNVGYPPGDAFVAKVNAAGTALVYSGYIGGAGDDWGQCIAVDDAGKAYIVGFTTSNQSTFPVTVGPDLTFMGGGHDAFVVEVNAAGSALVYAGYIGGAGDDWGQGIALDGAGNAYVTGFTDSDQTTFPVIGGPDLTYNGGQDVFVAKVNEAGTALVYAGYLGGANFDYGLSIAVDGVGKAYITGGTLSDQNSFPVTVGPDLTYNGSGTYPFGDAFVAKVTAAGTALVYAGYIGGSGGDQGRGIALDSAGNAYVTGWTGSDQTTFPVTGGPDLTYNGGTGAYPSDAFVAKVDVAGTALVYAGYVGGAYDDYGTGIALDGARNAYITGYSNSDQTSFPVMAGPDLTFNGPITTTDAFVVKVSVLDTAELAAYVRAPALVGAPPAGGGAIPIQYGNNGETTATSVMLTATLGSGLAYLSDTSGYTPTLAGNTITWLLPNMPFMYTGQFVLSVAVPNAPFGTRYPISLTLSSAGPPEDDLSDNHATSQVMIARQILLPLINRGAP
jgi:hypothetical protein